MIYDFLKRGIRRIRVPLHFLNDIERRVDYELVEMLMLVFLRQGRNQQCIVR